MIISYAEAFLSICFSSGSSKGKYTTKVTVTRYRYQYLYALVQLPSDVWSTVAEDGMSGMPMTFSTITKLDRIGP